MAPRGARAGPGAGPGAGSGAGPGALPDGWAEAFDPGHGRAYFFNVGTGERTWERPAAGAGAAGGRDSLPEGWAEAFDPGHGRAYFFNVGTGERTWERPAAAAPYPQSGPFSPAPEFDGHRAGCFFGTGAQGTGYYRDAPPPGGALGPGVGGAWGSAHPPAGGLAAYRARPGLARGRGRGRGGGGPLRAGMQVPKADGSTFVLPKDPFRKTEGYVAATTEAFREQTAKIAAERRVLARGRGRGRGRGRSRGAEQGPGAAGEDARRRVAVPGKEGHDPLDPSAYSTAPAGGWEVGLGQGAGP